MQKAIIYITLLIEVLGISIVIPAFPELKAYYGVGDFGVTVGLAIYSLFAFITAPILGQISDRYGRKGPLGICIVGTALSYFILLIQPHYRIFLISRIINGITGGNTSIIQAIIADISPDEKTKNKNFGLIGAVFGLGFIIGPVIGSLFLGRGGVEAIFWGGGILALLQAILLQITFQNTNTDKIKIGKEIKYNPLKTIKKFIIRPKLRPWLRSAIVLAIAIFIINSSQGLYMNNVYQTAGITYGYYIAIVGLLSAINMAILIPRMRTNILSTKGMIIMGYASMILGYIALIFMPTEQRYIGMYVMMAILSGPRQIVYNQHIISQAEEHEVGELSGTMSSLGSIGMVVGPIIGGLLLHCSINIHRGSAALTLIAVIMMYKYLTTKTD